jgi:Ca2+-transporting ATPase
VGLHQYFSPVHVIFLELIMGPTCSVIFENEPIEGNSMTRKPRKMSSTFFSMRELSLSIAQGLVITTVCLAMGITLFKWIQAKQQCEPLFTQR